eukprot:jgi/Chrpa1/24675/Chrysochromulina_OHIO_Genome00023094-RA
MQRYDADQSGTLELTEFGQLVHHLRRFQATQAVSKHQAELHRSYGMLEMALPASERFELRVAAPGATPGKAASVEQFDPAGQPCIFETTAAPSASKEDPNHMAMAITLRVEVALLVKNGGKHWAAGLATLDNIRYEVRHTRLDHPALNASCTRLALRMATRGCFNCSRTECEIVDRLLWGSDKMLLDSPPEPLELREMFDQVAPFDLAARVLKLAFKLIAMCSQRSRSDDPTEAHAAVELADLHACNFLFAVLHRSLSTFRYVGLSTEKKHVTWHTPVLARRPRPPPMVAASFRSTLTFAEGAPMLLRPSASTDGHEYGFAMLRALTKMLRALTDPR